MSYTLKYKIIKSKRQYFEYCQCLESLLQKDTESNADEIELLTLLIEKWDEEQYHIPELDPIQLIKALMKEHEMKSKDLVEVLKLSKGTISKILNYQKGLSKVTIRKLSEYFKMKQESFNRPYKLENTVSSHIKTEA
jgi:HTH-type transcriptional regulator/antitoxin HigA